MALIAFLAVSVICDSSMPECRRYAVNLFLGSIPIAPRILLWFSGPSVAVVGAAPG